VEELCRGFFYYYHAVWRCRPLRPQLLYKEGIPTYFYLIMAANRIIPNSPIDRPYDELELQAMRNMGVNDEYVCDDCICAKNDCDECNPGEGGTIGRPNTIFQDEVKKNQLQHCHDTIQACWNAWDQACKFEDGHQAAYYLDLLTLTQQYQKRLLNLKKKNH